jgi:methanogenic corrinoid protein MtbC1
LLNRVVQTGRSIGQIAKLPEEKLESYLDQDGNGGGNGRGRISHLGGEGSSESTDPATVNYPGYGRRLPQGWPWNADPKDTAAAESTVIRAYRGSIHPDDAKHRLRQAEAQELLESCLRAVEQFDAPTLEREIERASVRLGRLGVVESVVLPLVELIGESWHQGRLRMAHEHMAIAVIRTYMGTLINTFRPAPSAPRALAATPIHQLHELGALAAALGAAAEGWQVTYLGPNVPAEELAKAAELAGSSAVLLSVLLPENDTQLESEIMTLRKLLPDGIKIMIGGHICGRFVEAMSKENIDFRTDPAQLRIGLRDLAESLR